MAIARRLPGFSFESQPPPLNEVLPRMDIAVFVGFAASGPLQRPVVVEDVAHFRAIFGEDVPLAWDAERGEQVYAYLAPAVRAFFRNGGRRCWVVRIAGAARPNFFAVPGLFKARVDSSQVSELVPALAQARSEGSWSDGVRVASALSARPIELIEMSIAPVTNQLAVLLQLNSPGELAEGDLVKLSLPTQGYEVLFPFKTLELVETTDEDLRALLELSGRRQVRVTPGAALWLSKQPPASVSSEPLPTQAQVVTAGSGPQTAPLLALALQENDGEQFARLGLDLPPSTLISPGTLVRVDYPAAQLWLLVQNSVTALTTDEPPRPVIEVSGPVVWWLKGRPELDLAASIFAEKLSFELWARQSDSDPLRLSNLGFVQSSSRFWGALPTDEQLHPWPGYEKPLSLEQDELRQATANPRFPLAGLENVDELYFPLWMPTVPERFEGALQLSAAELESYGLDREAALAKGSAPGEAGDALTRNGLASFDEKLFIDAKLSGTRTADLLAQADFLRYQSSTPRSLTGIHAALSLEEATLIVVPDAVHRGWRRSATSPAAPPLPSGSLPRPHWWHFLGCDPQPLPLTKEPPWGNFLDCGTLVIEPPVFSEGEPPDPTGTFTLRWSEPLVGTVRYILEEATRPDFKDAGLVYSGPATERTLYGRSQGNYYYRVRVEMAEASSDWSAGIVVQVALAVGWQLLPIADYKPDVLLAVQRALLRMCAARGDLFAVLALPEHHRETAAIEHIGTLKQFRWGNTRPTSEVEPLGFGEAVAFSYGALYHPWPIVREEGPLNQLVTMPPDGVACGILARRTLERGAWLAPANELLRGVVGLKPPLNRAYWLRLQEAQLNLIRQEPRGFLSLSADTLSDDPDLRPINVRRLLSLLRRLALREGTTYVFEPNSPAFRRSVQRSFEALLEYMFARGAFAGSTAGNSFQVVVSEALNTRTSIEQGRFIVELRVAPALPLTFLTVRLVQTGNQTAITEGR